MNVPPVLHDHYGRNRNGHEHGKRRGDSHWNPECQQRNGNESLAETKRGTDQGGYENNGENQQGDEVNGIS